MGFLKRFRRQKSPKKSASQPRNDYHAATIDAYHGPDQTQRLPDQLLRRIFEHVCPHSADESLDSSEDSGHDGCMSCDMRDLAHCALTKRQWYGIACGLLYNSIRIDAVHYCEIEEEYADVRRRKSRNGDDMDAPSMRLQQLGQSVRDNQHLGQRVRLLKLPYMTRESCRADIARLASACPNLEFVDLPDGFFNGDASCQLLRQELQARCPRMRKMKYTEGGEPALETLLHGYWQELRSVELVGVHMEPSIVRQVFGMLPQLRELACVRLAWMNDSIFINAPGLPPFPALASLRLEKVPGVTAGGLAQWLSSPMCGNRLATLKIKSCAGIAAAALHVMLHQATGLTTLDFSTTVAAALPMAMDNEPLPPLASRRLRALHFEVLASSPGHVYPPSASYYQYLARSLLNGCLPALRRLYVRDPDFPETLTLVPPVRPFGEGPPPPPAFAQPLEVFSKGTDELEWIFTSIIPPETAGRRPSLSGGRPVSSYSAHKGLGPQWGGEARKSVVVPNGFGGFLAVPADHEGGNAGGRPKSLGGGDTPPSAAMGHGYSHSLGATGDFPRASWMSHAGREKRASRADLWR